MPMGLIYIIHIILISFSKALNINVDNFLLTFLSVDWNKCISMGILAVFPLFK